MTSLGGFHCSGLTNEGANAVYLKDVRVYDVKGFQIVGYNSGPKYNIYTTNDFTIDRCYGRGLGTNDVFGGGDQLLNLKVINSVIEQNLELGTYRNAFDMVHFNTGLISNNLLRGNLVIGSEAGGSKNVEISNNVISSPLNNQNKPEGNNIALYQDNAMPDKMFNINIKGNTINQESIYPSVIHLVNVRQAENNIIIANNNPNTVLVSGD